MRIDILSREQNNYVQSFNEQQRISPPELQVRRLSQQDWPQYIAYASPSSALLAISSIRSKYYEL